MREHKSKNTNEPNERRQFLRALGIGAMAMGVERLLCKKSMAADVQYNKADLERVNEILRNSDSEREAFYAEPQGYLKRHGIILPKEMIPTRKELEESLKAGGGLNPKLAEPALASRTPKSMEPALAGR
jgi:hypothetical protein